MARLLLILTSCALTLAAGLAPSGDPPKSKLPQPVDVSAEAGSSRAWALMTCSVPFERDGFRHDLLAGALMKDNNSETLRKVLELDFKVANHSETVELLNRMLVGKGLHGPLDEMFATVHGMTQEVADAIPDKAQREIITSLIKYEKRVKQEKAGMLAYESVRFARLCRLAYGAGYITEAEAWKRIEPVCKKLQKSYSSWKAVGEIYAIGLELTDHAAAERTWAAWKKLDEDEKSPWKSVAWDLKLVSLDKPEPVAKKPDAPAPK